MSSLSERLDIRSLLHDYAAGRRAPAQVIDALYARIERASHPHVFIELRAREALLSEARMLGAFDASKPLWGVPFAIKDNIDLAAVPTTAGCEAFRYVPARSAEVVARLLAAGALCLGKTNLDQFATGLVGTRSPYGACRNVFDPDYLAGGSSSGSAVAVSAGYVSFALGTDTAGSGRVPAALGNIAGIKPTRGLLPMTGVVPACRTLDCVSVFSSCVADGALVREVMLDVEPPWPRVPTDALAHRIGVPQKAQLEWFGDLASEACFERAVGALRELGCEVVEIDWEPFARVGDLLYGGPWLAERTAVAGELLRERPDACLAITREIILGGTRYSAIDAFEGQHALAELSARTERILATVTALLLPTVPTPYTLADDAREPKAINDRLGTYTRFANFLGCPVHALPAGMRPDGLPFGVQLVMRPGLDRELDALALPLERALSVGMGLAQTPLPPAPPVPERAATGYVRLAVVGAHLRGLSLHHELSSAQARLVRAAHTAPSYRLYALPSATPKKPGLVRVASGGVSIAIELYDLPVTAFGAFVARIPAPLGIGTLTCDDGEQVKGFLCEPYAVQGAEDISHHGGFRAYLEAR